MLGWVLLMTVAADHGPEAAALAKWRAEVDARMRGAESPLARESPRALATGHNLIGSGAGDNLRFDRPGVPEAAVDLIWEGGQLKLEPRVPIVLVDGQPAVEGPLHFGARLELGPLTLTVQGSPRGPSLGVCDASLPAMIHYKGLHYLPTDWSYRVPATFAPADAGKTVTVDTSTGGRKDLAYKGVLSFTLHGKPLTLEAFFMGDHPNDLFVIFKDQTSGKESYGAGRFLLVPNPVDGKTTIDFNHAWNPLCAYSHAFNCPMPPPENRLPLRVPVGEATYPHEE